MKNVLTALESFDWHKAAECRDHPTPDDFHVSTRAGTHGEPRLASPGTLRALELCARCEVRVPCLAEALTPWKVSFTPDSGGGAQGMMVRASGLWGGSFDPQRTAVRKLSLGEAIRVLEEGLPARLEARRAAVAAYWATKRGPKPSAKA